MRTPARTEDETSPAASRKKWLLAAALAIAAVAMTVGGYVFLLPPNAPAEPLLPPTQVAAASLPIAAPGATYVGGEACAGCHQVETTAWKTSHHALAMQHATEANVLGDFRDAKFVYGDVISTFFRRDDKFMVRTDGPDGALHDYDVKFTFGVTPLQQYLVELPGGRLQALSIAWDARPKEKGGQRWFHLYPDETIRAGDPLHWTGLQHNWNYMCADCHSTNLRRNYDLKTNSYATTFSDINVSCESCHGPGSRHLTWSRRQAGWESIKDKGLMNVLDERRDATWALDSTTGNSTRSHPRTSTREIETCAFCHSRRGPIWSNINPGAPVGNGQRVSSLDQGLYFPDGQIRDEVYEYGSFLQSRMFHAGVTCSDCHEPHSLKLRAAGNGVCLQCHSAEKFEAVSHHHHEPSSTGAECVSCHMPARTYMVVDPRRDHSLRIPRPDLSAAFGTPNACNNCHSEKTPQWAADQIRNWFPTPHAPFQNYAEILAAGTEGAPGARERLMALANDRAQPAIARASALTRFDRAQNRETVEKLRSLLRDSDPLIRRAAAGVYRNAPPDALSDLLPLLDDSVRDVRLEAARLLAALDPGQLGDEARRKRERGIAEYIASQQSNAERPESHHNLGLLFMTLGRGAEAETELKKALDIDANFVPAAVTLADLYRASGRDLSGGPVLQNMVARQPDVAAAHHALGLWLVRMKRGQEALLELKRAADLGSTDPRNGYVYAVALASNGQRSEAMQVLQSVLQAHRYHRESLYAMATFERDAGAIEAAKRYADELRALEPNDPSAANLVRQLAR
ncbi:multiheme c-type cytochrome [Microvirga sp. 2MCAF38]|uniref:multiheme c-type cytochrome n=1 Tax=Microvirga sp. 2MCAF38 TaxID=3232989 RepID=UPI003F9431B6